VTMETNQIWTNATDFAQEVFQVGLAQEELQ